MSTKPIQEFIIQSEENLRIAAAVAETWPEARSQLVSAFLDRLDTRLKGKLKGWETFRQHDFFNDYWAGYYVAKPAWGKVYGIGFECIKHGGTMDLGISRGTNNTQKQPLSPELLDAVQSIHPSAKSHPWWEAFVTLRSPAPDWRKPDVLWRMHKDAEFLTDVADQLVEIAEVSEHVIDRLVRKK
jgi:hypothetical protein